MARLDGADKARSAIVWGKLGFPAGCGKARCGDARMGDDGRLTGIYQRRRNKRGFSIALMKKYTTANPQTVPQQANRAKFAAAQAAWVALSAPEKAEWSRLAKRRHLFGWNLFIRQYYKENP